ncbi:ZIP family metal transporter [Candidatus Nomurabacteria bacterium]|nr:ZIP family metal transporter [Candidatus Nomurabacteria bacterium]
MLTTYIYALSSVLIISLISLVGVFFISLQEKTLKKYIGVFISLAVGALLGDAFIHIIPEALTLSSNITITSLLIISGLLIFFTLEKFLHWHHHHGEENELPSIHPTGKLILVSDGIHNVIDGIIIGASFLVSIPIGIATTLAVILHEIPQEIGDFAVLLHSGYSKTKALWLNFLSALLAIVGVVLSLLLGSIVESAIVWILPIVAGGFIYIAVADLIPELHKHGGNKSSISQIITVVIGVLLMFALTLVE